MFGIPRFTSGLIIGFGAGFLTRDLLASENSAVRPLIKGSIKAGMDTFAKGREALGHMRETLEDLVAEIRSERSKKKTKPVAHVPVTAEKKLKKTSAVAK